MQHDVGCHDRLSERDTTRSDRSFEGRISPQHILSSASRKWHHVIADTQTFHLGEGGGGGGKGGQRVDIL